MSANQENILYIVDGSSYLYRAYHALPPLANSLGEPTGAVFGVANMIRKLTIERKPEYIAIIFDAKGKNFRHELYKEYKAHRPPMPDDLKVQIEPLHKLIKAMGLPLICVEGVEADDVIATLAKQAESHGWNTMISTIDKDIMQLVNPRIKIMNDMTKTEFDEAAVIKKFGVPSSLVVDYLSLIGDTADNIPGVPGIGPKTAVKLLNEYGNLENLIKNADQIQNKVGQNLRAHLDYLPIAKKLVTLKHDVNLEFTVNDLKKKPTIQEQLIILLEALSFKSWLNDELKNNNTEPKTTKAYKTISSKEDLLDLINLLKQVPEFSFDTETTSLNPREAKLVGLSFSCAEHNGYYIPVGHVNEADNSQPPKQLDLDLVIKTIAPLFADTSIVKVAQNLKYDTAILNKYNIIIAPPFADTMLESYVFNSTANKHDLDTLATVILNHNNIKYEDLTGKGSKQINFNAVAIDKASEYAAEDADITLQLHKYFYPKLQNDKKLFDLYNDIELPLVTVLAAMEEKGVLIDPDLLLTQSKEIEIKLDVLSKNIFTMSGQEFNIDSPKQLQEILYDKLQLPILEKTPTGQASTAESVLQELALDYPIASDILEYRSLRKLKSTYTDSLPLQISPTSSRIHTSFHQAITATGRLSSSNPNLQNIPIKNEEGRKIRKAFIAAPNNYLISCDYSQIELRIMAHLSQDRNLLEAFNKDLDIHSHTAAEIFNTHLADVSSEQRRHAKAINFGLIYGMSSFGLAKQLGIDMNNAQSYIDTYFARYPGVKKYMDDIRKIAEAQGYVETLFGRRLYLPEIKSKNFMRRRAIERLAINAPMQGTAADLIKKSMIAIHQEITNDPILSKNAYLILQVHDELIVESGLSHVDRVKNMMINAMQNAASLSVPLKVACNVGHNWDEAH